MTEQLHCHFSLSCIGEGNGNPLQCSCLEIPRDGGPWWACVYGVVQSRTGLKQLNSSSSSVFVAVHGLSLFVATGATLWLWCAGFLCSGFSHCVAQVLGCVGSVVAAHRL